MYFSLQITIENPDPWDKPREGRPPIFHRNGRVEIIPNDQGAFLWIFLDGTNTGNPWENPGNGGFFMMLNDV